MKQPSRALIAEPPLLVLPSLAVAIGVNQAILLQQLHFLSLSRRPGRDGCRWVEMGNADLLHTFPFWSRNTVYRMTTTLTAHGLLRAKQTSGESNTYTLDYQVIDAVVEAGALPKLGMPNVGRDPAQGGDGTLPKLGRVTIKELSEVKRELNKSGAEGVDSGVVATPMTVEWTPDLLTCNVLDSMGIGEAFRAKLLPEFRLYWIQRGEARGWGGEFVAHCRRQHEANRPRAGGGQPPPRRPGDDISGKQPDAAEVLAKSMPAPGTVATPEQAAAHLDNIAAALGRRSQRA